MVRSVKSISRLKKSFCFCKIKRWLRPSKHGSLVPPWARCLASLRPPPCTLSPAWTPTCQWRGWFEAPPSFWHPTSWLSLAACCAAAWSCQRVWSGSPPSASAACRLRKQRKQTTNVCFEQLGLLEVNGGLRHVFSYRAGFSSISAQCSNSQSFIL